MGDIERKIAMLRGSCLCRGIRYEISGALTGARNCHCSMCRKAHGAAFRSRASVRTADFRLVSGNDLLTFFESSPGTHRGFCRICGSPIVSKFDADPSVLGLPLGALDDDPGIRPKMHIYVADKAPWHVISDDLPQFARRPAAAAPPPATTSGRGAEELGKPAGGKVKSAPPQAKSLR
jgi:hypothetical protein